MASWTPKISVEFWLPLRDCWHFSTFLPLQTSDGILFYITGISAGTFFFNLAKSWSKVLEKIEDVESTFKDDSYSHSLKWSLRKKLRFTAAILLLFSLSEHLMSWSSFLYERVFQMKKCKWEIGSMFYYIATTHLGHIYADLPVKVLTVLWAGLVLFFTNVKQLTFVFKSFSLFLSFQSTWTFRLHLFGVFSIYSSYSLVWQSLQNFVKSITDWIFLKEE